MIDRGARQCLRVGLEILGDGSKPGEERFWASRRIAWQQHLRRLATGDEDAAPQHRIEQDHSQERPKQSRRPSSRAREVKEAAIGLIGDREMLSDLSGRPFAWGARHRPLSEWDGCRCGKKGFDRVVVRLQRGGKIGHGCLSGRSPA
jgi:hypothetical protein